MLDTFASLLHLVGRHIAGARCWRRILGIAQGLAGLFELVGGIVTGLASGFELLGRFVCGLALGLLGAGIGLLLDPVRRIFLCVLRLHLGDGQFESTDLVRGRIRMSRSEGDVALLAIEGDGAGLDTVEGRGDGLPDLGLAESKVGCFLPIDVDFDDRLVSGEVVAGVLDPLGVGHRRGDLVGGLPQGAQVGAGECDLDVLADGAARVLDVDFACVLPEAVELGAEAVRRDFGLGVLRQGDVELVLRT